MWADIDTNQDFLNYGEVAELALDIIRDRNMLPVSIGIFGTWGTGKSSLLNLVETGLLHDTTNAQGYIVVRFDAWLYQGFDDARAALMEVIASRLLKAAEEGDGTIVGKAKQFVRRVNYFRLLGLLAEGAAAMAGIPTFGVLTKGAEALEHLGDADLTEEDVEEAKKAGKDILERGKGLVKPKEKRTPPKEIAAFRSEFADLLSSLGKTLVVFIDNLDRCLPKQTIHTLEALRLFLFLKNTAFVVAADEEMVRLSHLTRRAFFRPVARKHSEIPARR